MNTMSQEILNEIRLDLRSFMSFLCIKERGYTDDLEFEFSDRVKSHMFYPDKSLIKISIDLIYYDYSRGFTESSTIHKKLKKYGVAFQDYKIKGLKSCRLSVVHEFAHAIHFFNFPNDRRIHGDNFCRIYARLIKFYQNKILE